jgi:hypothetical protein
MRRARIIRVLYHPNHPSVGKTGWLEVEKPFRPKGWDENCYTFYFDDDDKSTALREREFEFLSDRNH